MERAGTSGNERGRAGTSGDERERAGTRGDGRGAPREERSVEGEGSLEQVAGRWRLRFVRTLAHPPEKVWRALTEPEHLAVWFPTEIHGEREAGAALRFVFAGDEGPPFEG